MRSAAAFILFSVSAWLFATMLPEIGGLWDTAYSFKLHHEAGSALCLFLARPVLALAAFSAACDILGVKPAVGNDGAAISLMLLVPLLLACSLILQNEIFYSAYDPKGYPVHPPEIIAHPRGAWVSPRAHAFASFMLAISGAVAWHALRKAGIEREKQSGT